MIQTRYIDIVFMGPPTADVGALWEVRDDMGKNVEVGQWHHDGVSWVFRIPVELIPRLIVPERPSMMTGISDLKPGTKIPLNDAAEDAQAQRRALKEKVMADAAAKKAELAAVPDDWELCPNCQKKFDPREDTMQDCVRCGEPRCTAICLPDPAAACLDCQALSAGPEEGGYDPSATDTESAFARRVFDGGLSAKQRTDSTEEDDD